MKVLSKCRLSGPGEVCEVQTLCGPQYTCYQCAVDPWWQPLGNSGWGWHVPHDLGPWARGPPGIQTVWQWGVRHRKRGRWRWEMSLIYLSNISVAKAKSVWISSFTRLWQWCDERERDQLHHQGLIHQHATDDGCEAPLAAERALSGWKVFPNEAVESSRVWLSGQRAAFRNQDKASPAFFSQHFFSCVTLALTLPFWNNSAFSASLLSFNGCPSVIILLRSLIPLEDKGLSGKIVFMYVCTKDQVSCSRNENINCSKKCYLT